MRARARQRCITPEWMREHPEAPHSSAVSTMHVQCLVAPKARAAPGGSLSWRSASDHKQSVLATYLEAPDLADAAREASRLDFWELGEALRHLPRPAQWLERLQHQYNTEQPGAEEQRCRDTSSSASCPRMRVQMQMRMPFPHI